MTVTRTVRIDDDLQAQVKQAAAEDQRSLNGEIAWLLRVGLVERMRGRRRAYMDARWPGGNIPDDEMGEVLNAFDSGPSSPRFRAAHEAAMALINARGQPDPPGLEAIHRSHNCGREVSQ